MKLIGWTPPPALAVKVLGPEPGGGRPSLACRKEQLGPRDVWSRSETWELLTDADDGYVDNLQIVGESEHFCLVFAVDGKLCPLSWSRADDLTCTGTGPLDLAEMLVWAHGGAVVDTDGSK